jgi:hypothetical protein
MPLVEENIMRVLREASSSLTLVEITDALNRLNSATRTFTYDEIRGRLEQMDEVHESRGKYALKG